MNREEFIQFLVDDMGSWGGIKPLKDLWSFQNGQYVHTIHDPITIDDWNRAKIVANTKVRILSHEHSAYVQKLAFEAGLKWLSKEPGLVRLSLDDKFFSFGGALISHGPLKAFKAHSSKEIFIEMPSNINARVLAEKTGSKHNAVHNPKHYEVIEGVEAIELIAAALTLEQWRGYCLGNIMKYRLRAGKKDALQQDIDKANEYEILYLKHADTCKGV